MNKVYRENAEKLLRKDIGKVQLILIEGVL